MADFKDIRIKPESRELLSRYNLANFVSILNTALDIIDKGCFKAPDDGGVYYWRKGSKDRFEFRYFSGIKSRHCLMLKFAAPIYLTEGIVLKSLTMNFSVDYDYIDRMSFIVNKYDGGDLYKELNHMYEKELEQIKLNVFNSAVDDHHNYRDNHGILHNFTDFIYDIHGRFFQVINEPFAKPIVFNNTNTIGYYTVSTDRINNPNFERVISVEYTPDFIKGGEDHIRQMRLLKSLNTDRASYTVDDRGRLYSRIEIRKDQIAQYYSDMIALGFKVEEDFDITETDGDGFMFDSTYLCFYLNLEEIRR